MTDKPKTFEEKLKEAKKLVQQSQKSKGGNRMLDFACNLQPHDWVSTGVDTIDQLTGTYEGEAGQEVYTGLGGIPRPGYIVIWGPEGVGKSTLVDRFIAKAQAQELLCLLVDGERRRKLDWMLKQGINPETLLYHGGGVMEHMLQQLIEMLQVVDYAVVDTVQSLAAIAEIQDGKKKERTLENNPPMGRQAAALSKFFRIATHRVATARTGIILVGQARDKTVNQKTMLDCVGGHALRHNAMLRLKISKITDETKVPKKEVISPDGEKIKVPSGFVQKIKLEKAGTNHLENQVVEVPFLYGIGPDDFNSNIMAAVVRGVIAETSAGRFEVPTAEGEPLKFHGRNNLIQFFKDQPDHYTWLINSIMEEETDVSDEAGSEGE